LAHVDAVEFDEVNALLKAKNDKYHRKLVNRIDFLWQVWRKRTVCGRTRRRMPSRKSSAQHGRRLPDSWRKPGFGMSFRWFDFRDGDLGLKSG
jgi:hypothetical protein